MYFTLSLKTLRIIALIIRFVIIVAAAMAQSIRVPYRCGKKFERSAVQISVSAKKKVHGLNPTSGERWQSIRRRTQRRSVLED